MAEAMVQLGSSQFFSISCPGCTCTCPGTWVLLIVLETSEEHNPFSLIIGALFDPSLLAGLLGTLVQASREPQAAPTDSGDLHPPLLRSGAEAGRKGPCRQQSGHSIRAMPQRSLSTLRLNHCPISMLLLVTAAVLTWSQTNS